MSPGLNAINVVIAKPLILIAPHLTIYLLAANDGDRRRNTSKLTGVSSKD